MTPPRAQSAADEPSAAGSSASREFATPEELRQKSLRPYFPLLYDWLKHDLESVEVPGSAELEGRRVELGRWEQQQFKAVRLAPAFGLKPEASLVLEGVAFQFAARRLEDCFEIGPMPEPDEIPRFLDEIVAQLAVGIALKSLLQSSVDALVQQGKLNEAKQLTEFRGKIIKQLADLENRVGSLELDRADEAAPYLIATPEKEQEAVELEKDAGPHELLEEVEPPLPGWASFADEEPKKQKKLPPWLHDEPDSSKTKPNPRAATSKRVKPMLIVLVALIVVYAMVIWPRVSSERPTILEAKHFVGIDLVKLVRARPPSLYVVVDGPSWDDAAPKAKIEIVESMAAVAVGAGYSGIHVRATEGRVVAEWLKNTGVAIRESANGGS